MTIKEKIEGDFKQAYKNKELKKKDLLNVLKAEISRNEDASNQLTDAQVSAIVKKMIESLKLIGTEESNTEISYLEVYLPTQLSTDQIQLLVNDRKSEGMNMGQIMGWFKKEYEGQYDGKVVSQLAK